eukprot:11435301-Heterocapsa_arctica.AAC.1
MERLATWCWTMAAGVPLGPPPVHARATTDVVPVDPEGLARWPPAEAAAASRAREQPLDGAAPGAAVTGK